MADLDFSDLGVPEQQQPLSFRTESDLRRAAAFSPAERADNVSRETSDLARAELEAAIATAPHPTARAALQETYARDFGGSPGIQRTTAASSAGAALDFSDLGTPEGAPAQPSVRRGGWGSVSLPRQADERSGGQLDYFLTDLKIGWNGIRKSIEGNRLAEYGDLIDSFERRYSPAQIQADPKLKAEHELRKRKFAEAQTKAKEIDEENQALQATGRPSYRKLQESNDGTWTLDNLSRLGGTLIENPGSAVSIVTQSGPASVAMLASAVLARAAGFSGMTAAAAGGNASRVVEFGSDYAELREKGLSHEDAYRDATIKSGIVGLLDAVSMKSAGNALDDVLGKGGFFGKLKTTGKELAKQSGLGMAGEGLGSLASGRTPDPLDVLAEGVGELAMGPVEAITTFRGRPRREEDPAAAAPVPADDLLGREPATRPQERGDASTSDQTAQQRLAALSPDDPAVSMRRIEEIEREMISAPTAETDLVTLAAERDRLAQTLMQGVERGRATTFTTESGARIDAEFGVVEADQLRASHRPDMSQNPDYPAELQPRDRSRAASELQVAKISGNLAPERLAESGDAGTGAPIIGADGLVESGNARTIGVQRAYQRSSPQAQAYRDWLVGNAAQFGVDPDKVAEMRSPMLVRVRRTPVNRVEFATQANQSTVAQMSPAEQARSDAGRMGSLDGLYINDDGEFMLPANDGIIRGFFRSLPITEQAALVDQNGRVSPAGYARFRNALLAKAYGNNPVVERLTESMSPLLRNLTNALIRMAPMVAKAKESMQSGQIADRDITDDIVRAVDELVKLRMEGRSLGQMLAQSAMFADLTPETIALMEFLDENVRSPARIGEFIQAYIEELERYGSEQQSDMFGGVEVPGRADLIQTARQKVQPDAEGTQPEAAQDSQAQGEPVVRVGAEAAAKPAADATPAAPAEDAAAVSSAPAAGDKRTDEPGGGAARAEGDQPGSGDVEITADNDPLYEQAVQVVAVTRRGSISLVQRHLRVGYTRAARLMERMEREGVVSPMSQDGSRDVLVPEPSKPVEKAEAPVKPKREPKPKPAPKTLTAEEQAQADLDAALGDLGDLLGKGTRLNITPEQESKLVPILTRLFDAAFRLGYHKFKRAAKFVLDTVRAKLGAEVADQITIEHLQGAYIGMSGKYREQGADAARDVVTVDTLDAIESADNANLAEPPPNRVMGSAEGSPDSAEGQSAPIQDNSSPNVPGRAPLGGAANASVTQGAPHPTIRNSETLSDLGDVETLRQKGFRGLDAETQSRVLKTVLAFIYQDEVYRPVVESIPVEVVNQLVGPEFTAQDALGDKAVFIHALATNNDLSVRAAVIDSLVRSSAISIAEIPLVDPRGASGDAGPTGKASDDNAHDAATSPSNGRPLPTKDQIRAGNYALGHYRIGGLDVSIENPAGSIRTGRPRNGRPWAILMQSSYGYIKGTVGKDKDHVDVFIKPGTPADYSGPVWVIDQNNADGSFDEHKAMIGWAGEQEARDAYLANYMKGWESRIRGIRGWTMERFRTWLKTEDTTKPASTAEDQAREGARRPGVGDAIKAAGLKVTKTSTKNGSDVWEVSGNTREHSDVLKRLGGRWYGPKKVWSFYKGDPTADIAKALGETKAAQAETKPANAESAAANAETKPAAGEALGSIERLDLLLEQRGAFLKPVAKAGYSDLRAAIEALRNPRSPVDALDILQRASERLHQSGYVPQSEVIDEVLEQLRKERGAAPAAAEDEPTGNFSPAHEILAGWVRARLIEGASFTSSDLFAQADTAFGGTQADGKYTPKDAYDALELGVNQFLRGWPAANPTASTAAAQMNMSRMKTLMGRIPSQTKRTQEQDEFQQFSTPPTYAYLANWVANIRPDDVYLEPSAGIGGLAVFGKNAGATVIVNEFSPRRATILRAMGFDRSFTENAEQLHNALPDDVKPTVVVMNPPFSATAGRIPGQRDFMNGARHIDQALQRLVPGGRLVVIMGKGRYDESSAWTEWIARVKRAYTLAADVVVDGKEYAKYGTTFDVRFMVFDKTGTTQNSWSTVKGEVSSPLDALTLLEGVRNARPQIARTDSPVQSGSTQSARPGDAQGGGRGTGGERPAPAGSAAVGDRQPGTGSQPGSAASVDVGSVQSDGVAGQGVASVPPADGGRRNGVSGDGAVRADEQPQGGSDQTREPGPRPDSEVAVSAAEEEAAKADITDSVFESYAPQRLSIPGAKPHPGKLVQSAAMASVQPPAPTYTPNLPKAVIDEGKLSLAQLEAVVYAGQAHSQLLPSGERMGFFIGDGTGVGKGREISGIILDNMRQGRNRAVWVSEKQGLYKDARRDFSGVGGNADLVFKHSATKYGEKVKAQSGILFTTYATLRQDKQKAAKKKGQTVESSKSRVDQIADWLGADFDGVIVFDEAHNMGNAIAMKGDRGMNEASEQALAGVELQRRLPQARVVYVSATGATEVSNLSYASRLGLWGEGTPFPNVHQFIGSIEDGGLSGMELVARDIKQMGAYLARSLSFDGVTYSRLEHPLTNLQRDIYNELARSWQIVLQNVNEALELTGAYSTEKGQPKNGRARAAAMSAFWGAHQRFFNQIITSMQMPAVIDQLHKDIEAGDAAVLQLVNTNEAIQNRQLATMAEDETLEDLDLTPRENLVQYIKNSFPIVQYEEYLDENNNKKTRPAKDSAGNVLISKEAVAKRDALLETLQAIRVPDGPLEIILNEFGTDVVAEVTGRGKRVLRVKDKDGSEKTIVETRPGNAAQADAESFMSDKKRILVFSDAGGTGFSFHADLTKPNQRKRKHYLIQPGWRADKAVQGFGRTHRTNQKSEPHYYLVTTDLLAQKRFISSIARRLDQLGALTKGQRDTANQGLFTAKDNLESKYAEDAVLDFFTAMHRGQAEGFDFQQTTKMLGFDNLLDEKTGQLVVTKIPHVPQFLNRLLSLETHEQERVFNEFARRMELKIDKAIAEGTLDAGMQTVRAQEVRVKNEQVVNTDERTGAETRYVEFELTQPTRFYDFDTFARKPNVMFYQNIASGKVWSVVPGGRMTKKDGAVVDRYYIHGTGSGRYVETSEISPDKFKPLTPDDARTLWDAENAQRPKTYTEPLHMVVGSLLPVWDRMPGFIRVARTQTVDGKRYLGRIIAGADLSETLKRLGASSPAARMAPADVLKAVMEEGRIAELANGWRLMRRRVSNENRLEVDLKSRFPSDAVLNEMKRIGGFVERIQFQERVFLPANDVSALERLMKSRPVVDLTDRDGQAVLSRPAARETRYTGKSSASVRALRAMVGEVVSKLQRKPAGGVLVVEFPDELPPHLRNYLLSQNAMEDVEGLYDPETDAIYLIARNIANDARGQYVLFHELFGHFGLRGLFGESLNAELEIVAANNANIRAAAAKKRADFGYDVPLSIEEAMSDLAAEGRSFNGIKRFLAALQRALRRIGLAGFADMLEGVTDAEALRVIALSRSYVEGNLTPAQYRATLRAGAAPTMSSSSPTFYSALTRAVAAIPQKRATPEQWKGMIQNLKGLKADEIEWSGVMEWLSMQAGPVTRESLVEYLHLNGVKVEETLHGGDIERNELAQQRSSLVVQLDALGYTVRFGDENTIQGIERRSDNTIFWLSDESWPYAWVTDESDVPQLTPEVRDVADRLVEVSSDEYDNAQEGGTRYEQYTLPGGVNYRELLLTVPPSRQDLANKARWDELHAKAMKKPGLTSEERAEFDRLTPEPERFRSNHWDEPNIVAHVRFNERTDADGKRVLFIEEIQSDWAQQGKRKGFDDGLGRVATRAELKDGYYEVTDQRGRFLTNVYASKARNEAEALAIAQDLLASDPGRVSKPGVPSAPFVTKTDAWVALALKRMIRWGAENGFDRIAWTTGEQQAERYDLSKRVSRVEFHDNRSAGVGDAKMEGASSMGQLLAYDLQAKQVLSQPIVDPAQIAEFVGKDVADKLLSAAPESIRIGGIAVRRRRVNGLDLKVGGEGMIAFYDKIVPGVARDVVKRLGGGAITTVPVLNTEGMGRTMEVDRGGMFGGPTTIRIADEPPYQQPGFDITPKMREIAMQGVPLFSRAGTMPARTSLTDRALAATTRAVGLPKLTGGTLRLIGTVAEGVSRKVLGSDIVENIKAGVVDKYGLSQAVLDRRAELYGRQATQLKGVEKLIEQLATLTRSELAVLYRAATTANGDEVNAMISELPEESKAVLANMKSLVHQLGQEAVRLGQMQADTAARNEWAYLHRTYKQFELEQTKGEAGARARRIGVLGDAYKLRGMVKYVGMKQIQNIAPEFWKRKLKDGAADTALKGEKFIRFERRKNRGEGVGVLDGMDETSQLGRLLEVQYWPASEPVPARFGAWHEAGTWEARFFGDRAHPGQVGMWRDFTADERQRMGEIDDVRYAFAKTMHLSIHNVEVGRYLEWLANTQAVQSEDKLPAGATAIDRDESALTGLRRVFRPDEWVLVPQTRTGKHGPMKYGKLAGMYVPGPIWNDIRQTINTRWGPEWWRTALRAWKISKTALSPVVHMNNVMANIVMADWHDIRPRHVYNALVAMTGERTPAKVALLDAFEAEGGTQGMYVLSEIQREQLQPILDQLREDLAQNETAAAIGMGAAIQALMAGRFRDARTAIANSKLAAAGKWPVSKLIAAYQAEDQIFRLAAFIQARERGLTNREAGRFARESFLDYDITAPWIQALRQTAFPFISFTYRALPMLLDIAANKPHKLLKIAMILGGLNAIGYLFSGGDEDEERKLLPEEKAGRILGILGPKLVRMPWNDSHGSPVFLDVRRFFPLGDFFDVGATHAAIPIIPAAVPGGPLAVLAEVVFNKSQFTGKAITKDTDTAGEKAAKVGEHVYKALSPNLPILPGTYSFDAIANAATGRTDAFGRERSVGQAALSSVGVKLAAYPPDVAIRNLQARHAGQIREIGENISALRREFERKGITRERFEALVAEQIAKRQKLERELAEKVAP